MSPEAQKIVNREKILSELKKHYQLQGFQLAIDVLKKEHARRSELPQPGDSEAKKSGRSEAVLILIEAGNNLSEQP